MSKIVKLMKKKKRKRISIIEAKCVRVYDYYGKNGKNKGVCVYVFTESTTVWENQTSQKKTIIIDCIGFWIHTNVLEFSMYRNIFLYI